MNNEEIIQYGKLLMEAIKFFMAMTDEATDEKIITNRKEIKEAVKDWA